MTPPIVNWLLGGLDAYLLGSIPFGFLIARSQGVDIRKLGSGNIGATNVFRCVSKPLGVMTFIMDLAKGAAGCLLIPHVVAHFMGPNAGDPLRLSLFCGVMTIVGHNWPIFLGFKGGKGIATSAGLLLALAPLGCLIAVNIWIVALLATRFVSVASMLAAVGLGVIAWPVYYLGHGATPHPWWFAVALDVLAMVAIWRHRGNLRRLREGTESRITLGKHSAS